MPYRTPVLHDDLLVCRSWLTSNTLHAPAGSDKDMTSTCNRPVCTSIALYNILKD